MALVAGGKLKMAHIDDIGNGAHVDAEPEPVPEHDPESDFFPVPLPDNED